MAVISMKALLESGVHFGHRTNKWDPRMRPYIFTERNGIHIIDLQQTVKLLNQAYNVIRDTVQNGGTVLFVGTKRQAQETVAEEAARCGMPYVTERWMGGMLTNWSTMFKRIQELERLEKIRSSEEINRLTKKEGLLIEREITRLQTRLSGSIIMKRRPDLIFIVDVGREEAAVHESNLLNIPIVALVDTNCNPQNVDYVIPSNDDAIRAIKLLVAKVADAVLEGKAMRKEDDVEQLAGDSKAAYKPKALRPHDRVVETEQDDMGDEILLGEATLAKMNVSRQESNERPFSRIEFIKKIQEAEIFIRQNFSSDNKWIKINKVVWEFLNNENKARLSLSAMEKIAEEVGFTSDDVLSLVNVLANPNQTILKRIFYRELKDRNIELVSDQEIIRKTRSWFVDKSISESDWLGWAEKVMVGWEPVLSETLKPRHRISRRQENRDSTDTNLIGEPESGQGRKHGK